MSGLKLIRRRISSVKSTKQITRAMKLVSAAKLRKTHDIVLHSRTYLMELELLLQKASVFLPPSFTHPLLQANPDANVRRVYIVAGDRGLCGAYNANILKTVQRLEFESAANSNLKLEFVPIGRRAAAHAKRAGWTVVRNLDGLPEDPTAWPLDEIFNDLENEYCAGRISQAVIYFSEFVSAMSQQVKREVILPFARTSSTAHHHTPGTSAEENSQMEPYCRFSPDAGSIFTETIAMMLRAKFLQAALESKTSEHAARMTAMDAATNNADDLIEKLRLHYNRARQSAITRELIDIVGGAEAIK